MPNYIDPDFNKKYQDLLQQKYPSTKITKDCFLTVSPFIISVPLVALQQIKKAVRILYKIAHLNPLNESDRSPAHDIAPFTQFISKKKSSLLMAYDFHWNTENSKPLKLIEVNTNATGYLLSELINQVHEKPTPALLELKNSFKQEWSDFISVAPHPFPSRPNNIVITDESISKQERYMEFLMYKDLLNSWGWECQLLDIDKLRLNSQQKIIDSQNQPVDMIYNRCTDWYFKKYPSIKQAFLKSTCLVSPHPLEYHLLANKKRMQEWSAVEFWQNQAIPESEKIFIQNILPQTGLVDSLPTETLWNKRKTLFFKPLQGYGGKMVYNGKYITKKTFQQIVTQSGIYQELIPPACFKDPQGGLWKYDIRAYVYKDQIQHVTSRVYQGASMLFDRPGSGFATLCVE